MIFPDVPLKTATLPDVAEPGPVTSPEPDGAAHVPSPLQNVELEALVPLFRLATGRLPVTSLARRTVSVLLAPDMVLFVRVWLSVVPTTVPEGTVFADQGEIVSQELPL